MEEFYEVLKEHNNQKLVSWFFKSKEEAKKKIEEESNHLKLRYGYDYVEKYPALTKKWTITTEYFEYYSYPLVESISLLKHKFED